jgi:hypothetical protein
MARIAAPLAALIALGVVVAVAFGAEALWVYGFFALLAGATAIGAGLGGPIITQWSRRRFERDRR